MPKFRKKPVVIEAWQWGFMAGAPKEFLDAVCNNGYRSCNYHFEPHIHTLEGTMLIGPLDWIIKGVAGEYYPCKPDIFAQTYEPAESVGEAAGQQQMNDCCKETLKSLASAVKKTAPDLVPQLMMAADPLGTFTKVLRGELDWAGAASVPPVAHHHHKGTNYIADFEIEPQVVTFENGRKVWIARDGVHVYLEVGWVEPPASEKAEK